MELINEPKLIEGRKIVDDRGYVSFNPNIRINLFVRQYLIKNHTNNFVRAWHGHKFENKLVQVIQGIAMVCCIKIDNWQNPNKNLEILKYFITSENSSALFIPKGYANGFMNLTQNTILLISSDKTVEESQNDDIRFNSKYWNPWKITER